MMFGTHQSHAVVAPAVCSDYETRLALEVSKAKREARRVTEAHMHPVAPVFTPDRARPLRDSAK